MTGCGPAPCGVMWPGAEVGYLHRCVLPAAPPHPEHVCGEGVTFRPSPRRPPVPGDRMAGELVADAVTGFCGRPPTS